MRQVTPILFVLLTFIACTTSNTTNQQTTPHPEPCSSKPCDDEGATELKDLYETGQDDPMIEKVFKVKAHIIQYNGAASNLSDDIINTAIKTLNVHMAGAKIQFQLEPTITRSNSSFDLNDVRSDQSKEEQITNTLQQAQTINLYLIRTNNLLSGYTPVLSHGFEDYHLLDLNKVFISHRAIRQAATVAHEFGHFFNLQHTFGDSPLEGATTELPDGSNCNNSGDFICDTPADPNGQQDCCDCSYQGTITPTSSEYLPLTNNFMSYYKYCCRTEFTEGQLKAINLAALKYRSYLK